MIRCPGCSSWVPLARHVLVLGETVTLDCPVCRGAVVRALPYGQPRPRTARTRVCRPAEAGQGQRRRGARPGAALLGPEHPDSAGDEGGAGDRPPDRRRTRTHPAGVARAGDGGCSAAFVNRPTCLRDSWWHDPVLAQTAEVCTTSTGPCAC